MGTTGATGTTGWPPAGWPRPARAPGSCPPGGCPPRLRPAGKRPAGRQPSHLGRAIARNHDGHRLEPVALIGRLPEHAVALVRLPGCTWVVRGGVAAKARAARRAGPVEVTFTGPVFGWEGD